MSRQLRSRNAQAHNDRFPISDGGNVELKQPGLDFAETSNATLDSIFNEALRTFIKKEPRPEIEARFYPYAGLSSTIRLRQGRVYARVSDILTPSPPEVLYALACILIAKLYRRKAPKEHEITYRNYAARPTVVRSAEEARKDRGYKVTLPPKGKIYDLNEMFDNLNERYFGDQLARPLLSWSKVKARRILGHHDHVHGTITLSLALDSRRIPRFVVEYVLYHEMLHVKYPPRRQGRRTVYHSPELRADERRFEQFEQALKWLETISLPARKHRTRRPARRTLN